MLLGENCYVCVCIKTHKHGPPYFKLFIQLCIKAYRREREGGGGGGRKSVCVLTLIVFFPPVARSMT